jgi:hypothetical protein
MPGRRHLLDSLPEGSTAPHNVEDLRLIPVNLNRARPKVISRRIQIYKFSWHGFSYIGFVLHVKFELSLQMKKARSTRALTVNSVLITRLARASSQKLEARS